MPRTTTPKTPKAPRKPAAKKPVVHRVAKKVAPVVPVVKHHVKKDYIFAVGRRKEAVARVRWHQHTAGDFTVNGRPMTHYFPSHNLQYVVTAPLVLTHNETVGHVTAKVAGGGSQGQAEAVRLGIARALVKMDADLRLVLKQAGYLRRDPRVKERKKYGLKRARRAPQWQKR